MYIIRLFLPDQKIFSYNSTPNQVGLCTLLAFGTDLKLKNRSSKGGQNNNFLSD